MNPLPDLSALSAARQMETVHSDGLHYYLITNHFLFLYLILSLQQHSMSRSAAYTRIQYSKTNMEHKIYVVIYYGNHTDYMGGDVRG